MPRGKISPPGSITINANGYSQTKIENGKWIGTHVLILEEKLGRKLRAGERALFKDGDKTNLDPDNIILGESYSKSSVLARIARLRAEVDDRLAVIKDLESQLEEE